MGRSYSYGDATWDGDTEPLAGDYDYKSYFTKNIARPCAKFRREYEADKKDKNSTAINFPILRYSDVLLMVAEAENELNGPDAAYDYLNKVRERAGASTVAKGSLDKEGFRQMVRDERARELCFEYTRHFDLIRWGEFESSMKHWWIMPVPEVNGTRDRRMYIPISRCHLRRIISPIPDAEMAVNKAITSNNPDGNVNVLMTIIKLVINENFKIIYLLSFLHLAFTACTKDLTEGLDKVDVNVVASENVTMEGGIVTVRKGTPVEFSIAGEPDFITFFSGEIGHQYIYRQRVETEASDIVSSKTEIQYLPGRDVLS